MSVFDSYENPATEHTLHRGEDVEYAYTDPDMIDEHVLEAPSSFGSRFHTVLIVLIVGFLFLRLAQVQIAQGKINADLAKEHGIRQIVVSAERGAILDRRGHWLVRNAPNFVVTISPNDLPRSKDDRVGIYSALAGALQWSSTDKDNFINEIESRVASRSKLDPIVLKSDLSHDDALLLTEKLEILPAVNVVAEQKRQYFVSQDNVPVDSLPTTNDGLAHILGYVGRVTDQNLSEGKYHWTDFIGKSGVELSYDAELRGQDGINQTIVDSKGKILRVLVDQSKSALEGDTLVLNIDLKLQSIMAKALGEGLQKSGLKSGVAMAMDPRNGAILGMVSLPAYDNNQFAGGVPADVYQKLTSDENKPLYNRATQGTYPPGSTIKPFMAAIGLQEGVITEKTRLDTPPEIQIGQQIFPNWQRINIPNVDVKKAIANSNDIFFYALGGGWDKIKGLGIERIDNKLPLFGFGAKTGVDISGESVGRVPSPAWKKKLNGEPWYVGDTYHMAIGQGDLLVTPLQLIMATTAIANGGTLYQPRLADHTIDATGATISEFKPIVIRERFIDENNIRIVREGMRQTVTDGSGRQLQSLPVTSAGKTGTAQVGANNEFLHSWFEVFAPYDNPEIALVVLGEKGSQENEGHTTAVPIAKSILEQYFSEEFKK